MKSTKFFLLGIFAIILLAGFTLAQKNTSNNVSIEEKERFFDFDRNSDGEFTNSDLGYWVAGYKHGIIGSRNILYVIDKVPKDGKYVCKADVNGPCLNIPLYTREEKTAQVRSLFILNAFGAAPLRAFPQSAFSGSGLSAFSLAFG